MKPSRRKLLLFANSRRETEELAGELKNSAALEKLVVTHHSSLSSEAREQVEQWFSSAPKGVCISTSTLEMGIDIGDIDAVVLYGPTTSIESLLQRVGRGNRRANKTNAICISSDEVGSVRESALFSTMLGLAAEGKMPNQAPFELYGAIAQQCLVILLQQEGGFTMIRDILDEVASRSTLTREVLESILSELAVKNLVQHRGFKNRYGAADGLWELADKHLLWGNFPLGGQTIDVMHRERHIGSIPRANLLRLRTGTVFRFGGSRYRVSGILDNRLKVDRASGKGGDIPLLFGGLGRGGLETFVAAALWSWVFAVSEPTSYMQEKEWKRVSGVLNPIRKHVDRDDLPHTTSGQGIRYFTFGGATLNRVLRAFFGVEGTSDDLSILVPSPLEWSRLPVSCADLAQAAERSFVPSSQQTMFQQFLPVELQRKEWMEAWLKDRDAEDTLQRLACSRSRPVDAHLFQPFVSQH